MKRKRFCRSASGFTLVELMIVVIILSILAAIIVPQFAGSTTDAKNAALDANLNSMRSVVELYYQQHGGVYPSVKASSATGTAGSNTAFVEQLTLYSDAAGGTANSADATHIYGPYLKKGIPVEPVSGSSAIEISTAGTLGMTASSGDPGGYKFDNKTGQLIANTAALQAR